MRKIFMLLFSSCFFHHAFYSSTMLRTGFLLFTFYFLLASPAWGATYWVSPSGSDKNSCSSISGAGEPGRYRKTITAGIACLRGGDTLMAKDGVYAESVLREPPSGTSASAKTTIKSVNSRGAIIKPTSGGALRWNTQSGDSAKSNIRLEGLVLSTEKTGSMAVRIASHYPITNLELVDLEITNGSNPSSTYSCISIGKHGSTVLTPGLLFKDSLVHHCLGFSSKDNVIHGIYIIAAQNAVIENNVVHTVTGRGINFFNQKANILNDNIVRGNLIYNCGDPAKISGGMLISDGARYKVYRNVVRNNVGNIGIATWNGVKGLEIYHNTIYKNLGAGVYIRDTYASGVIIKNNIILDNSSAQIKNGSPDTVSSHNYTAGKATNVFKNPAGGDLTLKDGSPAIDAGVAIKGFVFNGAAPDQGAYETNVDGSGVPSPPMQLEVRK